MNAMPGTSRPRRIWVITASVGAGHNSAARAIIAGLGRHESLDVEYIDVLNLSPLLFRAWYAGGYALAVSRFPFFYGLGYRLTNRPRGPGRSLFERRRLWQERRALKHLRQRLLEARPNLIVHTHFLAPPMIARMIRREELAVPQMVVVTDNVVHRYWYSEQVERYFVATEACAEALRRWSVAPEQITVSGIPIHPKWTQPLDREHILADWNLPGDKHIVLVGSGVEFTCGPVVKIACDVVDRCPGTFVVVLAGNNKKLLARLAKLSPGRRRLRGISFTDRVHELVEVCSLMVSKAGGITTTECLAKARGMVLLKPVPGQEAANAAYLERQRAAVIVHSTRQVGRTVARLLADPQALDGLGRSAGALHRHGTATIVSEIVRYVSAAAVPVSVTAGQGEPSR